MFEGTMHIDNLPRTWHYKHQPISWGCYLLDEKVKAQKAKESIGMLHYGDMAKLGFELGLNFSLAILCLEDVHRDPSRYEPRVIF